MTTVRRAVARDAVLGPALGAPPEVYPSLLGRQDAGEAVLLVAEDGGRPVGTALVRWTARDAAARAAFPGAPELSNLHVAPAEQGRGHGTALVGAAEEAARAAGHHLLGLAVADDNPGAARLYLRLGWRETGVRYVDRYTWTDPEGHAHDEADPVRYLVRDLP